MASYAVDSKRQSMRATGIVNEVREWTEGADGRRRPAEVQLRDENTGMPMWDLEVIYRYSSFGRESNVTSSVRVGAIDRPVLLEFAQVSFVNLTVEVRISRAGTLVESWRADGLDDKAAVSGRTADRSAA